MPWSNLRATQFHQLMDGFLHMFSRVPLILPVPKSFKFQSIDTGEVAARIAAESANGPSGRLPDLGGPQVLTFGEMTKAWQQVTGKRRPFERAPYGRSQGIPGRLQLHAGPRRREVTWEEWLRGKYGGARRGAALCFAEGHSA